MKKWLFLIAALAACARPPSPQGDAAPGPTAPATPERYVRERIHGVDVVDAYRWLEDARSEEVKAWMKTQDAYARARLQELPGREPFAARLRELLYLDTLSAPLHRGKRFFYTRRQATREKAVVYWKEGRDGAEKVLLDPNTWPTDGSLSLSGWRVSWDGETVAYQVSENNADESVLHVMDVATGRRSEVDTNAGAKYGDPAGTPEGDGFYYTWLTTDPEIPTAERPGYAEVRFHRLGTDPRTDRIVREKTGDPRTLIHADLSRDGHWLFLAIWHGWTSSDVYFKDLRKAAEPAAAWKPLAVGREGLYWVSAWKDRFYVHHNEGAPRWKVDVVDPEEPAEWKTLVPEADDQVLEEVTIVGGKLALTWIRDVSYRLELRELDGSAPREIALPALGSVRGPIGLEDDDEAYYVFTSFTYPPEIHSLSVRTGRTALYFRPEVPIDAEPYLTEQVFFRSKDGTRVPMFIVRRRDLKFDGGAPALLTGYGGFNVPLTPEFHAGVFPWLELGGVYAVANLRGGGEYGEAWHQAGMRLEKQNVFDDFIAAAEYLIAQRYTSPGHLAIRGDSNGGLLVGAAMTQRPELFRVVVCGVPLLDMLRYHEFGSGQTWVSEYGSADDEAEFRALLAYSPYHRVAKGTRYPSLLLLSADSDDRVDPLHARKFAAALQAASAGGPVLLRIEGHSGHGGADLIKAKVEELADAYAFISAEMGIGRAAVPSPAGR